MILDFGSSIRRYRAAGAGFIWTNGAPGGGAIIVIPTAPKYVGFIKDMGRLMNR